MKRSHYACVPAYAAKRLLGERYGGRIIPLDAVYFWDGDYYPVTDLAYDSLCHRVTMPDGVEMAGDCAVNLYDPLLDP